jgi:enoyl-CoA hydratase/isomerase-like protein
VRAIVVTSVGRAFCAGADLKEIAAGRGVDLPGHREWGLRVAQPWVNKPLIAVVKGYAMGGGRTEIALACDLVVASEEAAFGLPEVKRSLLADAGGVVRVLLLHLEVAVPRRQNPRTKLDWADPAVLVALAGAAQAAADDLPVTPDALLRWHRRLVRWRWTCPPKGGRTPVGAKLAVPIEQMERGEPRLGL